MPLLVDKNKKLPAKEKGKTFKDFMDDIEEIKKIPRGIVVKTDIKIPEKVIDNVYAFVEKYIDEDRQTSKYLPSKEKTDIARLKDEVGNFVSALVKRGKFSKGDLLGRKEGSKEGVLADMKPEYSSTAYWTVRIMKNLFLDTNEASSMKKFEKDLTDVVVQELKEEGIKA